MFLFHICVLLLHSDPSSPQLTDELPVYYGILCQSLTPWSHDFDIDSFNFSDPDLKVFFLGILQCHHLNCDKWFQYQTSDICSSITSKNIKQDRSKHQSVWDIPNDLMPVLNSFCQYFMESRNFHSWKGTLEII